MQGHLALVLHAHLPFVRHPEHDRFLEENWLFEAITETYVPLIQKMDGWLRDGMETRLTLTLSPTFIGFEPDGWREALTAAGYPESNKLPPNFLYSEPEPAVKLTPKETQVKEDTSTKLTPNKPTPSGIRF